jgi:hypothetical protein
MTFVGKGISDKLYWRFIHGVAHCFKKCRDVNGYISLCDRYTNTRSGGQECSRPPAIFRCGLCDVEEMKRRGVEESMPESPHWDRYLTPDLRAGNLS